MADAARAAAQRCLDRDLLHALEFFLASLHGWGVYFRSLHFGNVIVTEAGAFGLIDVAETDRGEWFVVPGPVCYTLAAHNL